MRVLVITAHPDDEVLGCGATMARLACENKDVYVAILGEGITSRYTERERADTRLSAALKDASRKVNDTLGAKDLYTYDLPDNRFDTVPLLDIVKIVERLVVDIRPGIIYTHHGGDLNIDHAITHRAVLTATRPVAECPVRDIYAFEVASSTEWALQQFTPSFRPTVFVDVSRSIGMKTAAMQLYESESRPFPHPRSPDALRIQAKRWGTVVGLEYAEAFELIRSIR